MSRFLSSTAVVLEQPEQLRLREVDLIAPCDEDVVVDVEWSGISTGTERLLYSGRMPVFPGMGYPLVPGYESVGRVVQAGSASGRFVGERVFVPGANCFGDVRGLFGGSASRLVTAGGRVVPVAEELGDRAVLLALAATAHHAIAAGDPGQGGLPPELVVGHGVLGRLVARVAIGLGHPAPTVWEHCDERLGGAEGYSVLPPDRDERRDYRSIVDVSGDAGILDQLIGRLAPRGEVVLAGFYSAPLSFSFPPAFMREARIRIAAEWRPADMASVTRMLETGALSLDGLITHRARALECAPAYRRAFDDSACLKMVLDWRSDQ